MQPRSILARQRAITLAIGLCGLAPLATAAAQTEFHDLEAGRPVRIEDAIAIARRAFDLQLAPVRAERLDAGGVRWQLEPRLAYGADSRLEVSLRTPFVYREAAAVPRTGLAGVGLGALYNFNAETARYPALATEMEVLLPAGSGSNGQLTALVKLMATRTLRLMRVHVNASYSSFSVAAVPPSDCADAANCGGGPPFVPDGPCMRMPGDVATPAPTNSSRQRALAAAPIGPPPDTGRSAIHSSKWLVGAAVDKTFPLRSLLVIGDVFAEKYNKIDRPVDWTAEIGIRKQLSPRIVLDLGLGRHFAGANQSWYLTFGSSYTFALAMLAAVTQ
jgi:hypothetical protein